MANRLRALLLCQALRQSTACYTYTLFEGHAVSGDSIQVDGAIYIEEDHIYRFYTEDISECMTLCTADADCMGFVDNHQAEPQYCVFKSSSSIYANPEKDFHEKTWSHCSPPAPPPPTGLPTCYTYTLFEEHAISGDSLQVDGATYTNADHIYRFYTEDISECMTLCTADADCMGFVDNHRAEPQYCVFKSSTNIYYNPEKDFHEKTENPCVSPAPPPPPDSKIGTLRSIFDFMSGLLANIAKADFGGITVGGLAPPPPPLTSFYFVTGSTYLVSQRSQACAQEFGAVPLELRSAEDTEAFEDALSESHPGHMWTGLTYNNGAWRWDSDGAAAVYTNWGPDQPNPNDDHEQYMCLHQNCDAQSCQWDDCWGDVYGEQYHVACQAS